MSFCRICCVALAMMLAIAAGAQAKFCSTLSKGGKQPLKTCKPFRDGVCDVVTSPPCSDKLCDALKNPDGCALVDLDALDSATRPVFGAWWIELNDKPIGSCTSEPLSDKSNPDMHVFCSRIGEWVNIIRSCPTDGYGNGHPVAVGGNCGVWLPETGVWWDANAFYNSEYNTVSCMFKPDDLPAELRGGRLYTTLTCVREGVRPKGAGGPTPRNLKGLQIGAWGGLAPQA